MSLISPKRTPLCIFIHTARQNQYALNKSPKCTKPKCDKRHNDLNNTYSYIPKVKPMNPKSSKEDA